MLTLSRDVKGYTHMTSTKWFYNFRVILRRCVHKKTVITGCQEETMVTEDTHVEQDSETPREIDHAIRLIIEQFVQGESNFETGYGAA